MILFTFDSPTVTFKKSNSKSTISTSKFCLITNLQKIKCLREQTSFEKSHYTSGLNLALPCEHWADCSETKAIKNAILFKFYGLAIEIVV